MIEVLLQGLILGVLVVGILLILKLITHVIKIVTQHKRRAIIDEQRDHRRADGALEDQSQRGGFTGPRYPGGGETGYRPPGREYDDPASGRAALCGNCTAADGDTTPSAAFAEHVGIPLR